MIEEKDGSSNSTFKGNSGFFFFFPLKRGTDLGHQIGKTTLVHVISQSFILILFPSKNDLFADGLMTSGGLRENN